MSASNRAAPTADPSPTVAGAREGSLDTFDDLVRATYDDTFSLALRLTGDPHDAHDVAQDTYLRAFRGLARFRGEAQISTWLFRITTNSAATLRSRRRRHGHDVLASDSAVVEFDPENDPSLRADASELRGRLTEAIEGLPSKLRDVVILRDVQELSHERIAATLGISETAAKVRLHRARERLRAELFDDEGLVARPTGRPSGVRDRPSAVG